MHQQAGVPHGEDNDAFGPVRNDRYGLETWAYLESYLDISTNMARFPDKRLAVVCLSNMPAGQADEKCRQVLDVMDEAGPV